LPAAGRFFELALPVLRVNRPVGRFSCIDLH
jgi:hypothetical protein